jgi:pimeloyl-ACP methyl ester carboxylesterase
VSRDGVKIAYEVFGQGEPTVVFSPSDPLVQSQSWKAQVPYLSRRHRVITIDPRGNGLSDRPDSPEAYGDAVNVADTIAVMDELGVDRAVLVGLCSSAWRSFLTAALHPDRVLGVIGIASQAPFLTPRAREYDFEIERDEYVGFQKMNRHYWKRDWRGFAEFWFDALLVEPHSSKVVEDCVGWAVDIGADAMLLDEEAPMLTSSREETEAWLRRVRCPVLVIHGDRDLCQPLARGERLAELTGGQLLVLEGAGHVPSARHPVVVNQAMAEFLRQFAPPPPPGRWTHPRRRPRRVLFLSSPIGLGHSRRDLAIAEQLRVLRPELRVDWLAQPPLTTLLHERGEHIHPASRHLSSEAAHIDAESAEHDLHAFQAIRRMDEILVNNFMVFADLVEEDDYDAWIGDEAWELDYFLHENPRLKTAPYVWLTDFVGWLPMPDGGPPEAALAADYNADMVEQIARLPAMRDRALFVGNPEDAVPDPLGPNLPDIREWTRRHFDFTGYINGYDPAEVADRAALRDALGYRDDERVCVVTVGGSGTGGHLLRRVIAAYPAARALVPGLRMVVVAGPRVDVAALPRVDGVDIHGYVPNLYRHLAACDIAIVHGGLTTTMELTANRRPFIYVPLRHHFEQNFHVRHRLARYGAGRCLDYADTSPEQVAAAIAAELARPVDYRPVETDGAQRAAQRIAELLSF